MFDTTKKSLKELLADTQTGKLQLPDFQRGWVWDDDHIKSLLTSVSLSYPIGTIMLLQTGGDEVRFKSRPIEGIKSEGLANAENLILDGQQRLTSLFQALFSDKVVDTRDARKKFIKRWYYIDMRKAVDPHADREDAIISLSENRQLLNFRGEVIIDCSTPEKEYEALFFPLAKVFDSAPWRLEYQKYFWQSDPEKVMFFNTFESEVIQPLIGYHIPVIVLSKSTPKEAVCQVFEKVNTGGVSLTVFELLTATFAASDFDLRKDWQLREAQLRRRSTQTGRMLYPVLFGLQSDDFLQAVTLLMTWSKRKNMLASGKTPDEASGVSCKRKDILNLQLEDYRRWADSVTKGFEKAARLLQEEKVLTARDLPYRTQLVPLAAVYAVLGDSADNAGVRNKLVSWYWCGVFGELYSSAIETRIAKDLPEILDWMEGSVPPSTVGVANFVPSRLVSLKTRNSAAYKGLSALLMRDDGRDFITGKSIVERYDEDKVDIHHIFPADWCDKNGIDPHHRDSFVNKTPLSSGTNRKISNNPPSKYIIDIERLVGGATLMDEILYSHVIDPQLLRADQFDQFFNARQRALLERIAQAMGKPLETGLLADDESPEQFDVDEEIAEA